MSLYDCNYNYIFHTKLANPDPKKEGQTQPKRGRPTSTPRRKGQPQLEGPTPNPRRKGQPRPQEKEGSTPAPWADPDSKKETPTLTPREGRAHPNPKRGKGQPKRKDQLETRRANPYLEKRKGIYIIIIIIFTVIFNFSNFKLKIWRFGKSLAPQNSNFET